MRHLKDFVLSDKTKTKIKTKSTIPDKLRRLIMIFFREPEQPDRVTCESDGGHNLEEWVNLSWSA